MPIFQVNVPELHWATYEVYAENVEELKDYITDIIYMEEIADLGTEFSRTMDPSEVSWEICDENGEHIEHYPEPKEITYV
jgi:hypothetical protein